MIQLNINEFDLENEGKVKDIINKIMLNRMREGFNEKVKNCFDFYNGVKPVTSYEDANGYEPKVINIAKSIVDIATQTFIGVLPDIVTSEKKKQKEHISNFYQKLYNRDFGNHFFETCKYASKTGSGFIALYNEIGDTFPRFKSLSPAFAECVYDCTLAKKHVMSYYITEVADSTTNSNTSEYIIYVYTKKYIYAFKSPKNYFAQTTVNEATKEMIISPYIFWNDKNGNGLTRVEHNFSGIPIVEVPNNEELLGDAECVFGLISLYNALQNDRCKNVHDVVNYILMIKNVRLGTEEEQKTAVAMIKNNHLLAVEGDNVDAKFLSNPLNQQEIQTLSNDVYSLIQTISRVPDLSSVDFSQNASDPIIKIKTKPLLDLCGDKEKKCGEPYKRVLRMVLDFCKKYDNDYADIDFDLDKVKIIYSHVLPSNDRDMVTAIANLQNAGMASPRTLLQELSFVNNVEEYMKDVFEWNEKVDKRKNNNNNNGVNQHNIDKHNENPLSIDQMDNQPNFNEGGANVIKGQNQ